MKTLIFLFCFAISICGQSAKKSNLTPCSLSIEESPILRGFKLGQTNTDILQRIPSLAAEYNRLANWEDNKKIGYSDINANPIEEISELADINFNLSFVDGKLYFIAVSYEKYDPGNLRNFIKQVSETTVLPKEAWKISGKYTAEMKCADFTASIWTGREETNPDYLSYPSLRLEDIKLSNEIEKRRKLVRKQENDSEAARKRLERQRKLEEQRKKKIFKP